MANSFVKVEFGTKASILRDRLTARELSVLSAVAKGMSYKEVAKSLRIATHTVACHANRAIVKLGVNSRLEAVIMLMAHGVIPCACGGERDGK